MRTDIAHTRIWRHVKTSKSYEIIQLATREDDLMPVVVYRDTDHAYSAVWVQPASEFFGGRFLPNDVRPK